MAAKATRQDFGDDWAAVLERWARGGPVNVTAELGWAALGALERLMPERLADFYEHDESGNLGFSHLLVLGADLLACEHLEHIDRILARVAGGERGAAVELELLAAVVRSGLAPIVEPELHGKVLDFAVDTDQGRVFFEVVGPALSDEATLLREQLQAASASLFAALTSGERLQVGFLKEPTTSAVAAVRRLIEPLRRSPGVLVEEDSALMRLDPFEAQVDAIDLGPEPALGAAAFEITGGIGRVVNVTAAISDDRVRRLVAAELHHFSRAHMNILVLQVGAVPGALPRWEPLIRTMFTPSRNTRIGVVLLVERLYDGVVVPGAHIGRVLVNPHARRPVPQPMLDTLARGFSRPAPPSSEHL